MIFFFKSFIYILHVEQGINERIAEATNTSEVKPGQPFYSRRYDALFIRCKVRVQNYRNLGVCSSLLHPLVVESVKKSNLGVFLIFSHPRKRRMVTCGSTIRPASASASASASTLSTSSMKPLHGIISYCTCILVYVVYLIFVKMGGALCTP